MRNTMPSTAAISGKATAARIVRRAFPRQSDFRLVLRQLSNSNSMAPQGSAAATLFPDGFRLNVGKIEALTAFNGEVRLLLHEVSDNIRKSLV
jgi:hypothetical protein